MTDTQTQDPKYELARAALHDLAGKPYATPKDATTALTRLADHFLVMAPGGTTQVAVVPEGYQVLVTSVVANAPASKDERGDVFMDRRTSTWCFHAAFLQKLAKGVGIQWIEEKRLDDFSQPFVCAIQVTGRYRDYSGEWVTITGSHMMDLRDTAEHGCTTAAMLKGQREKIHQHCATRAKSRAIADACVSRTIDAADLGRPIIMAKLYRTDPVDPDEAKRALYGGESAKPADATVRNADGTTTDTSTGEVTQGKADPHGPSSGAAASLPAAASPASPARPAASLKYTISPGYPGEGKTFAEATDDQIAAYAEGAAAKFAAEGANWNAAGQAGAKAKIAAADAEIEWRMAQAKREMV